MRAPLPPVRLDRLLKPTEFYLWRYDGSRDGSSSEATGKWLLDAFPCGLGRYVWSRIVHEWVLLVSF